MDPIIPSLISSSLLEIPIPHDIRAKLELECGQRQPNLTLINNPPIPSSSIMTQQQDKTRPPPPSITLPKKPPPLLKVRQIQKEPKSVIAVRLDHNYCIPPNLTANVFDMQALTHFAASTSPPPPSKEPLPMSHSQSDSSDSNSAPEEKFYSIDPNTPLEEVKREARRLVEEFSRDVAMEEEKRGGGGGGRERMLVRKRSEGGGAESETESESENSSNSTGTTMGQKVSIDRSNSHMVTAKAIKIFKEKENTRLRGIKVLFNSEILDPGPPEEPKSSHSKLENLLKRTSMYEGPSAFAYSPTNSLSPTRSGSSKSYSLYRDEEMVEVDILTLPPPYELPVEEEKSRMGMNEVTTHVFHIRGGGGGESEGVGEGEEWEDTVDKSNWNEREIELYENVMRILDSELCSRLSLAKNSSEPLLRRASLDLAAHHLRSLLTSICWDPVLSSWLHTTLLKVTSTQYLAIYIDILQTLRSKVSPLILDRLIGGGTSSTGNETGGGEEKKGLSGEALSLLIKRAWDPYASITQTKGPKLSCSPVFLFVPAGPSWGHPINPRRHRHFVSMLSNVGKVITVTMSAEISSCPFLTVPELAEKMILSSKVKLNEVKGSLHERPIYLVGWGTGALIAATVSLTERVAGVICLGFPLSGVAGVRGGASDPLLQMKHPVLFVIGDRAVNTTVSGMEQFREKLTHLESPASAYLTVIKCGDSHLRVSRRHRRRLLITQPYVDKCIVDEIVQLVVDVSEPKPPVRALPLLVPTTKNTPQQLTQQHQVIKGDKSGSGNSIVEKVVWPETAERVFFKTAQAAFFKDDNPEWKLGKKRNYVRRKSESIIGGKETEEEGTLHPPKIARNNSIQEGGGGGEGVAIHLDLGTHKNLTPHLSQPILNFFTSDKNALQSGVSPFKTALERVGVRIPSLPMPPLTPTTSVSAASIIEQHFQYHTKIMSQARASLATPPFSTIVTPSQTPLALPSSSHSEPESKTIPNAKPKARRPSVPKIKPDKSLKSSDKKETNSASLSAGKNLNSSAPSSSEVLPPHLLDALKESRCSSPSSTLNPNSNLNLSLEGSGIPPLVSTAIRNALEGSGKIIKIKSFKNSPVIIVRKEAEGESLENKKLEAEIRQLEEEIRQQVEERNKIELESRNLDTVSNSTLTTHTMPNDCEMKSNDKVLYSQEQSKGEAQIETLKNKSSNNKSTKESEIINDSGKVDKNSPVEIALEIAAENKSSEANSDSSLLATCGTPNVEECKKVEKVIDMANPSSTPPEPHLELIKPLNVEPLKTNSDSALMTNNKEEKKEVGDKNSKIEDKLISVKIIIPESSSQSEESRLKVNESKVESHNESETKKTESCGITPTVIICNLSDNDDEEGIRLSDRLNSPIKMYPRASELIKKREEEEKFDKNETERSKLRKVSGEKKKENSGERTKSTEKIRENRSSDEAQKEKHKERQVSGSSESSQKSKTFSSSHNSSISSKEKSETSKDKSIKSSHEKNEVLKTKSTKSIEEKSEKSKSERSREESTDKSKSKSTGDKTDKLRSDKSKDVRSDKAKQSNIESKSSREEKNDNSKSHKSSEEKDKVKTPKKEENIEKTSKNPEEKRERSKSEKDRDEKSEKLKVTNKNDHEKIESVKNKPTRKGDEREANTKSSHEEKRDKSSKSHKSGEESVEKSKNFKKTEDKSDSSTKDKHSKHSGENSSHRSKSSKEIIEEKEEFDKNKSRRSSGGERDRSDKRTSHKIYDEKPSSSSRRRSDEKSTSFKMSEVKDRRDKNSESERRESSKISRSNSDKFDDNLRKSSSSSTSRSRDESSGKSHHKTESRSERGRRIFSLHEDEKSSSERRSISSNCKSSSERSRRTSNLEISPPTTSKNLKRSPTTSSVNKSNSKEEILAKKQKIEDEEEEEEERRVTRSMQVQPTRPPSKNEERSLSENDKNIITLNDDTDDEDESENDDEIGESSKKLRPIFPVTPASLSATRTRKVNIPKFFAYGM